MSREDRKTIKEHQRKRRNKKIRLLLLSILFITLGIVMIYIYTNISKDYYNKYIEKADLDYKVKLKENEFYNEEYLDKKNTLIASLIENIEANFNYELELEENTEYTYSYKIVAKTNVKEGSRENSIYETTEELVNKEVQQNNDKNLKISENIVINYDNYNEKINKFINLYNLNNTTNTLELTMYVYVTNNYDNTAINKNSKVMTMSIPLTTKTVDISIGTDIIKDEGKYLVKTSEYANDKIVGYMIYAGIISVVFGIFIFIKFIKYLFNTRTAETMYDQELKRILFNYKSYIQKINNNVNFDEYKVIQINTFDEILGLRDTMQVPILMYENELEKRTEFMIMNDGILYIYILGAKDSREVLRAKSAEQKRKNEEKRK